MPTQQDRVFDYDVALSFAAEDRHYVQDVADRLTRRGIRVFYDEYARADLWGQDLYTVLDDIYRRRARFTMIFVSAHYVSKPWTRHERQSAQARAFTDTEPYLLPVRLDDTDLPGLRPTLGYLDARQVTVQTLIETVAAKLASAPGITRADPPVLRVPRTPEQQRELLAQRPEGWEHLLYAGVLWQRFERLQPKWRDHDLGYARRTGRHLDLAESVGFVKDLADDIIACGPNVLKMLTPDVRERAFGPPDRPGDPILIEHIATRLAGIYEQLLDAAAKLRGTGVPREMAPVVEATARMTDLPLRQFRDFVDLLVAQADTIPECVAAGTPGPIDARLGFTIDQTATAPVMELLSKAVGDLS